MDQTSTTFSAPYAPDEAALRLALFGAAALPPEAEARAEAIGRDLVGAIRAARHGLGGVEELLHAYSLSTKEGLALMVLAEALLRVPDAATADRLIEDKLGGFSGAHAPSDMPIVQMPIVNASAWALGLSARIVAPGDTPTGILSAAARRLGKPAVRAATRQAMRLMGDHFVLGETIESALKRASSPSGRLYRYSFDMLGEGARTAADAAGYRKRYAEAIEAIGRTAGNAALPDRPGISVKLSALHPRYEAPQRERVLRELVPVVLELAGAARKFDLNFTIDAEEADRLELSLEVIEAVLGDPSLAGWDGFGLAIQAYQKRCLAVIDHVAALAERHDRRLMVRLVKGAYWDTEIKRAQERGLPGYPVFTSKAMTDLAYEAAAARLLALRPRLYPQFATHNAATVAAIAARAGTRGYEFQRLHGMGDALYHRLVESERGYACRTYAPVGAHRDLLAYLVRRLLENGANSSFVSQAADPNVPIERLLQRPASLAGEAAPTIRPPRDLFAPSRKNSPGVEIGERAGLDALLAAIAGAALPRAAASIVDGRLAAGHKRAATSPIDGVPLGEITEADAAIADAAMAAASAGARAWAATPAARRADVLDRVADALETERATLLALLQAEAGKTLADALAEWREAIDFCRYYAAEGRALFGAPTDLPGPTGESNRLTLRARGIFVAISPWNFPLAILTGQIAAALMAGNAVVAKPAEQTPLIAAATVRLMHAAGLPTGALQLVLGDGAIGARLVAHRAVAGVVFTGSTAAARAIARALAAKDGPIVPLIAETGGINAMIVDATALPEQVADDVVTSAFRSAGQRCSALRLLLVQEDTAGRVLDMVAGAAGELRVGDPRDIATDVGPVIDAEARDRLLAHTAALRPPLFVGEAPSTGLYVPPQIHELPRIGALTEEVFGPILHVVRYKGSALDAVLDEIDAMGFGLTLGVHSRIDATIARIVARLTIGNVYVNRNMIGAVVGSQPFGGSGLSGTGPKAGGPHYLARFAVEQTVSVNTAAAGGDVALMASGR